MRLPPMTAHLFLGIMGVMGMVAFLPVALGDKVWVGFAMIPLEFSILDVSTGRPIEGASIQLIEGNPEYEATTGPDGRARIVARFMTAGRSSLFRRTKSVNYMRLLVVSAEGHRGVTADLKDYMRGPRCHTDAAPPPIVIRLASAPAVP